jgi:hypothetical protein
VALTTEYGFLYDGAFFHERKAFVRMLLESIGIHPFVTVVADEAVNA